MESSQRSQNKTPKSTRKISGYLFFSREKREKLSKDGEKVTIAQLGLEWSALPDKTKQKFKQIAEKINNENSIKAEEREEKQTFSDSSDNRNNLSAMNKSKNGSNFNGSKKFKDEKIEKYFSENEQKKPLRSSNKKRVVEDYDSRFSSEAEANEEQSDNKTEKTEATEADKKNNLANKKKKKLENDSNNNKKKKIEEQNASDDLDKIIIQKQKIEKIAITLKNKQKEEEEENNKDLKLKSDKITKDKIMQDGMMYKKDRNGDPKTIRLCVEICAS
jgi:hypothetical protein